MARLTFALLASLLAAGCYHPAPANGAWTCSADLGACPSGYYCAGDNTCWKNGSDPSAVPDGGVIDGGLTLALAGVPTYPTSAPNPAVVLSADFTGDQIDDVLVLDPQTASMDLRIGQKDGTLGAISTTVLGGSPSGSPTLMAAGDFDGNGTLDVVVGGPYTTTVSIWSGDGTGHFTAGKTVTVYLKPVALAAGKLDSNKLADVVAAGATQVAIAFDADQQHTNAYPMTGSASTQTAVALGDVDGDGALDIVTLMPEVNGVGLYLNRNTSGFALTQVAPLSSSSDTLLNFALGDITGDGVADVVAASSTLVDICVGQKSNPCMPITTSLHYPLASSIGIADFDGDKRLDLILSHGGAMQVQGIGVALRTSDSPTFGPEQLYAAGDAPSSIALGDFDGDGRGDVAVLNPSSQSMSVLRNTNPIVQPIEIWNPATAPPTLVRPVVALINDDSVPDVILGQESPPMLSIFLGSGTGSFSAGAQLAVDSLSAFTSADIDKDGKADLIVVGKSSVSVLLGKGGGSFAAPVTTPFTSASPVSDVAVGDINDDRNPDIVFVASGDTTLFVLHGTGTATPKPVSTVMVDASLMSSSVAIGDVSGDHLLDVVAASSGHSGAVIFLQQADHTLSVPGFVPSVPGARVVRLADLDGDNALDLAIAGDGGLFTAHNTGGGGFALAQKLVTANKVDDVLAIDLTNDGRPELLAVSSALTQLLAFPNMGATFAAAQAYTAGALPTLLNAGNFYGAGKVDVVVGSASNGVALVRNVSR